MPTGDWCAGKTKETDDRVRSMAQNVSVALNDPDLRKRLDDKKRLSREEILQKVAKSKTDWQLLSNLSCYERQTTKNILCACSQGHQSSISLIDIINNVRCKTCHPKRNAGDLNPAYKNIDVFFDKLFKKFGQDAFGFDIEQYHGLYGALEFKCTRCLFTFTKAPRVLLNEKHGCPQCANKSKGDNQRRTKDEFMNLVQETHGDRFTYHVQDDQTFGNADTVTRTCNVCNTTQDQSVQSHLVGNGCSVCSQKRKHTTESFVTKAKSIRDGDEFDYSLVEYVNNKVPVILKCKKGHTFSCSPSNHLSMRGCPHCASKKFISAGETEWLNSLVIPAENRNRWINVSGQKFNVDALINSTIYEYYGDYWHGNLRRFKPDFVNVYSKMTMQEHYDHTVTREQLLREAGYVVITMWELDWVQLRTTRPKKRR
jgi:hypothetical protein